MGVLERESRRRKKRADIQALVLKTVATAGVLSAALVAPGVLGAFAKLGLAPKRRQIDIIRVSQKRLVDRGFLVWKEGKLRLTKLGERRLVLLEAANYQMRVPKRWDKKWRVLIFDIPETKKSLRDRIRRTLVSVGFVRLQDSVWIYPYPCEDLITLLKADFKIGKEMLYMIVDMLEHDASLRGHFELRG